MSLATEHLRTSLIRLPTLLQNTNGSIIYLFGMIVGCLRWLRRPITVATIVDPKSAQNASVGNVFVADSRLGMSGYAETVHREAMEGQAIICMMFMILCVLQVAERPFVFPSGATGDTIARDQIRATRKHSSEVVCFTYSDPEHKL